MASPTELDIFSRSLGGDRRARTELFKKYVRDSSRVCRLGSGYSDVNDFLQDTFNNLLRTGHSWDSEIGLSQWVETVAVWTALLNERQRDMTARGAQGEIRLCAEIEGEDATHGGVLDSYSPPLLGPEDSPRARLLALLSDSERIVFQKRAVENATWEETAAAAGKPLTAIGPIFARAAARLARLCGAPPPMDDDLVPVFGRAAADPQKPEGRVISLQLDAVFYTITPENRKIGLATSYDARLLMLWETAASATPPADPLRRHLDQCHYCTDVLRALILMQRALLCPPGVAFQLCPGSFTLANAPDMVREAFDQHLTECAVCRDERNKVIEGQTPRQAQDAAANASAGARKKIAWAVAALLVLGIGSFAGYRYFAARNAAQARTVTVLTDALVTPTVAVDPRYSDLVQNVPLEDDRIMASILPQNRAYVKFAIDQFSLGQLSQSLVIASQLSNKGDPGAQMIYAMCLYKTGLMTDGYREMLKAESMSPREPFRCMVMFQFALMVGDNPIMDREVQHLEVDPSYRDQVHKIMEKVRARRANANTPPPPAPPEPKTKPVPSPAPRP